MYKEAATRCVLWNKLFLKNLQNSQENNCVGVSILIKLQVFFTEHLQGTASVHKKPLKKGWIYFNTHYLHMMYDNKFTIAAFYLKVHCVKIVQILNFSWSDYGKIRTKKNPYLVSFHTVIVVWLPATLDKILTFS